MRKIFTLFAALVCGLALNARTLYLAPNENWKKDGARFAIYAFAESGNQWYDMSAVSDAVYQATIDDAYPTVIFCRMNPATTENNWDNKWNQTSDLTLETGKDLYTIAEGAWDKGAGTWSVYDGNGEIPGGETASYGIKVGETYYPGTLNPSPMDPSFKEYQVLGVSVAAGATLQLWDATNNVGWAVPLDQASVEGIAMEGDHYICSVEGCYNFYIKLKANNDQLYIGSCGGTTPGGGDPSGYSFYVMGWINGADAGEGQDSYDKYEDQYKFVDGKITLECTKKSYIGMKDDDGNFYYYQGNANATGNTVTLKWANGWSPCQKWEIPEGTNYIIIRSIEFKGNITLESVDKATYDAYHLDLENQAIDNTQVSEKAHKVIVDGQLRIIRGDKVFDATGRQL